MNDVKTYYLPIDTKNLGNIFSHGCICPSGYFAQWHDDLQSRSKYSLFLCSERYTGGNYCSLEIVFSKEEEYKIHNIYDDLYSFNVPLPISRIKKIFFQNRERSKTTIHDIQMGDAFVPDALIQVYSGNELNNIRRLYNIVPEDDEKHGEWGDKIDLFSRIIGGFALMRLGRDDDHNYSKNFFKTLSKINTSVADDVSGSGYKFNDYASKFINNKKQENSKIYNNVSAEIVEELANKKGVVIEKNGRTRVIKLDNITNEDVYILAALSLYGSDEGKRKTIDDFIAGLSNKEFKTDWVELLCLCFGINQRYSAFRNSYNICDKSIEVKFRLNSKVDYYTIESIYQYVFHGTDNNRSFEYLDNWCPEYSNNRNIDAKEYQTYRVLDRDIIYKKKPDVGSKDYFHDLLQIFSEHSIYREMLGSVFSSFPDFIKVDMDRAKESLEKALYPSFMIIIEKMFGKVKGDFDKQRDEKMERLDKEVAKLTDMYKTISDEIQKSKEEKRRLLDNSKEEIDNSRIDDLSSQSSESSAKEKPNRREDFENEHKKGTTQKELKEMLKKYGIQYEDGKGYLIKLLWDAQQSKND